MSLLPIVAGGPGDQWSGGNTTDQRGHPLGGVMVFADGRRFRYGRAGGVALATGVLCQQTLNSANWDELAVPTARAAGVNQITVTNGATAITADYFKDGFLNIEDDAGEGYLYTIRSNDAAAASGVVTIDLYETLQVALTTASTVTLFANPYSVILIHPSPPTAKVLGVAQGIIAITAYGWLQSWGPCSLLTAGTVVIADEVIPSASVDGAVDPRNYTLSEAAPNTLDGTQEYPTVGTVMEVAADTEYSIVDLAIS